MQLDTQAHSLCIPQSQTRQKLRSLHQSSASSSQLPTWAVCGVIPNLKLGCFPYAAYGLNLNFEL